MSHAAVPDGMVTFADGLPGFEACRRYLLITSPDSEPFAVVQGSGDQGPSFVAIDPRLVAGDFRAELDAGDLARLDARPSDTLLWLSIVTPNDDGPATVNLRAPLVINPVSMRGIQRIIVDSQYGIDHPLQDAQAP